MLFTKLGESICMVSLVYVSKCELRKPGVSGGQELRRPGVQEARSSGGQESARRRSGGAQESIRISGGQGVARSGPGVQEN